MFIVLHISDRGEGEESFAQIKLLVTLPEVHGASPQKSVKWMVSSLCEKVLILQENQSSKYDFTNHRESPSTTRINEYGR